MRGSGGKWWLFVGAALLFVLAAAGFLVAASGLIPIKASSGHWAITTWILQFGKRRSIATHTLGMELPPLDKSWMVLKGAGHYENGCRPCHGSPELKSPRVAAAMTPSPPYLPPIILNRDAEELFYIVKHGIKFTGMPAWPSQQRDDEVRAMVAFLLELPKLDARSYRGLVFGEIPSSAAAPPLQSLSEPLKAPPAVALSCARCHGEDGRGRGTGAFPKLGGQKREYLYRALEAYARGERNSGVMEVIAAGLRSGERRELADYYGALPDEASLGDRKDKADSVDGSIERGRAIAHRGIPERGVPSCKDCHGPASEPKNPVYPKLAGQYAEYLVLQLELFKAGHRGGTAYAHLMRPVANRLTTEQMRDVASYYAALDPTPDEALP